MAAGQDGPDQQGRQQPPAAPPVHPGAGLQPPYAQQSPYGQQPPYGYAPAGWGGPPPAPMERPLAVRVGIGAFLASAVLGLIGGIASFADYDSIVDRAIADARLTAEEARTASEFAHDLVTVVIVVGLLFVALRLLFIWFAWNGRHWARVVLWVVGGLDILGGLAGLAGGGSYYNGFVNSLSVFQFLLVVAGVIALALRPASEWYRYEGWRRRVTR